MSISKIRKVKQYQTFVNNCSIYSLWLRFKKEGEESFIIVDFLNHFHFDSKAQKSAMRNTLNNLFNSLAEEGFLTIKKEVSACERTLQNRYFFTNKTIFD